MIRRDAASFLRGDAAAHATWIGLALQAGTMALFISGLVRAGAFHPETEEMLTSLPEGVPAVVGYANRLLVVAYWRG